MVAFFLLFFAFRMELFFVFRMEGNYRGNGAEHGRGVLPVVAITGRNAACRL